MPLARRVFENILDAQDISSVTGVEQIILDDISPEHFAWLEVYNARFLDPDFQKFLRSKRPIFARRAGGNITAFFGKNN